jgi:hypothetical protein
LCSINWIKLYEEVSDCCLTPTQQFFSYIMERTSFNGMMMTSALYYYNTSSWIFIVLELTQQSADRHVTTLGNIFLIPRQPVFSLSPQCWVLSGEATITNLIVCGLSRSWLEHTVNRTRGEYDIHYITDAVVTLCAAQRMEY